MNTMIFRALETACFIIALSACEDLRPAVDDLPSATQTPRRIGEKLACRVTRISDGDSIVCGNAGRIRLLLIDAPELSQGKPGISARTSLERLIPVGTAVTVETDVRIFDSYGRILGYVYMPDGRMVNEEMARSGYVIALVYPPNVKYVERIRRAVDDAKKTKRGLWATDFFECDPRDYRAGRCTASIRRARPIAPDTERSAFVHR